ncbi:MAG: right-handed parallel beta-helix repeat-containing protein, partial [Bacteroidota bacterium]|nr:right-handed parallel beta-helix repeat-containing protein [Bacteroidota bacterium]
MDKLKPSKLKISVLPLLAAFMLSSASGPGPRGPVGPDVTLSANEKAYFSERVIAEGFTATAVQDACNRARSEGIPVVYLPSGEYIFDKTVDVPEGVTLLGSGAKSHIRSMTMNTKLFAVAGDDVRFTRLKLQGADTTQNADNNTYGISVAGRKNIRIDHCEILGFRAATSFTEQATALVDHCFIHHNPRKGQGYGVIIMSGAKVMVSDNEFSQCRHSLASNGNLDWTSARRVGKYLRIPEPFTARTHWEFVHNYDHDDDKTEYRISRVDAHPGMDGTFVVEGNLFKNVRNAVEIRDGAGIIRGNLFQEMCSDSTAVMGVWIRYGTHNDFVVENSMPHDIELTRNTFIPEDVIDEKYRIETAVNITIDHEMVMETAVTTEFELKPS